MVNVSFNGKFLSAKPTGVHRVAEELIAAVGRRIERDEAVAKLLQCEVLKPRSANRNVVDCQIQHKTIGHLTWQFWEQFELPFYSRQKLLVSLCNLSPLAVSNGITMIHDAQTFSTPDSYKTPFRAWYQFALPQLGKRQKRILTVSEYSKQELQRWEISSPERTDVVYNGVDHVLRLKSDQNILKKLGLNAGEFTLGLSNTQAHKNIKVLIEAYSKPSMSQRKLVLFGGAKPGDFEAIGLRVPANVIHAGFVSEEELRALLENASAILFPSLTEGFGLPPLEAMLLGTPAICAPCGALPEVCGSAALYADPHDPNAWVEKIEGVTGMDAAERSGLSEASKSQAEKFSWDNAGDQLIEIMISCLQ